MLLIVRFGRSFEIATAAPVLVLPILYMVIRESPMTIVFIDPKRKRNCLWSFMFRDSFPISAAWLAPSPGRNAVNGEAIIDANEAFRIDFLLILMFFRGKIRCSGIFVFCFILIIRLLAPNKPVRRGNKGSLILRFRVAIPRKPARRKIINAHVFLFSFSIKIR